MIQSAVLLISNLHCHSCVTHIQDVLASLPGITSSADVSLADHSIRVYYDQTLLNSRAIADSLLSAAFEVHHVFVFGDNGALQHDYDVNPPSVTEPPRWPWRLSKAQRVHIKNCKSCQDERVRMHPQLPRLSLSRRKKEEHIKDLPIEEVQSSETTLAVDQSSAIAFDGFKELRDGTNAKYTAMLSVTGMTCASCSGNITRAVEALDFVDSVVVNLVSNSARVVFHGPQDNIKAILETIDDIGYEASYDTLEPLNQDKKQPNLFKAILGIQGMTCGSCVGSITRGLEELPFVTNVNVDLVTNSATLNVGEETNASKVIEKIEDLGYNATIVSLESLSEKNGPAPERKVTLRVDGMYCEHCPGKVRKTLEEVKSSRLNSSISHSDISYSFQDFSLQNPRISVVYKPAPAVGFTVRTFIDSINATDTAFSASVYHPPTLEERSRKIQRKEQNAIAKRLVFTSVAAIPTFVIGVVYMSLVPKHHPTRMWFDQPVWAGNVMRMEWALFIIATTVMFFGVDVFHRRAFKELWWMWRPGSKVPFLRRFYRFGSMNMLISAGTLVAYVSSLAVLIIAATTSRSAQMSRTSSNIYFDVIIFLPLFVLIGKLIEAYSKAKAGDTVAALGRLRESDAFLVGTNDIRRVPADQLEIGDVVQIPHGHSPPTDGTIDQEGNFSFDESSLTGESKPAKKHSGDSVYTGSVNVSNPVRLFVTGIGGNSLLDQIINVVREGQAKRAPIERFADQLTGYFVPIITFLAVLTWLIWLALGHSGVLPRAWLDVEQGGWTFWSINFAVSVFVVACPCGIGLAAPTALFIGGGLAAKHGILVQGGGEAFQEASRLNAIVFDKTGTLTQGQMKVTDIEIVDEVVSKDYILAMAKLMEESSTHPIAKAISEYCSESSAKLANEDIKEISGQGMTARFMLDETSAKTIYDSAIGNEKLMSNIGAFSSGQADTNLSYILERYQTRGDSIAIMAVRKHSIQPEESATTSPYLPIVVFAISDPVRPEAPGVIKGLQSSGIEVHMCTGDNTKTAHAIASQLGIAASNIRSNMLPQDKATYIRQLQNLSSSDLEGQIQDSSITPSSESRKLVAFVGDGTNDTPALSASDVSIALASGSDIALTAASFILLNSDLNTILTLSRLAKRVFLRVKLNFAWAIVYNVCLIPVAAGVFYSIGATQAHGGWRLGPVWASAAMAASSVSVVLSSLALRLPEVKFRR